MDRKRRDTSGLERSHKSSKGGSSRDTKGSKDKNSLTERGLYQRVVDQAKDLQEVKETENQTGKTRGVNGRGQACLAYSLQQQTS